MLASVGEDLFRAVLQGAPPGTVYALVALGFVLAYKTSGIFNLAFGAQAYVSAVVYFKTHTEWGWPIIPVVHRVGGHPRPAARRRARVAGVPPSPNRRTGRRARRRHRLDDRAAGDRRRRDELRAEDRSADRGDRAPRQQRLLRRVGRLLVQPQRAGRRWSSRCWPPSGWPLLFKFTTVGLRMRAVVESPRMTELNGIAADRVSAGAWALSSFFAGLAGVLIAPRFSTLAAGEFFNIVVVAIAAAAVGYLVSLPRAFLGGLGLGILIALFNTFIPKWSDDFTWLAPIQNNLTPAIPFIVLFGILVFSPKVRQTQRASDPLAGVDPPPTSQTHGGRRTRGASPSRRLLGTAFLVACGVVLFTRGDTVWIFLVDPGGRAGDRVPVDHRDDRLRRPHLPGPGRVRRDRRFHRLPTRRPLRHAGPRRRVDRRLSSPRSSAGCCRCRCSAQRHLDRHRHAGVRLLLQLGDGQVLLGRRLRERRRGDAARRLAR